MVVFGLACLGGGSVVIFYLNLRLGLLAVLLGMHAVPDGVVRIIRGLRALAFR